MYLINISLFAGNLPLTVGCSDPARCCHNVRNVTIRVLNCDIETVMNKQYSLEAPTCSFSFSKLKAPSSNASTLLNKYAFKSKIGTNWYANIKYLQVILKRSSHSKSVFFRDNILLGFFADKHSISATDLLKL